MVFVWYSRYNQYRGLTVNIPYCILSMSEPVWQSPRFPPTLTTKLHRTRPSFQSVWNMCKKIQEQSWKKFPLNWQPIFQESRTFYLVKMYSKILKCWIFRWGRGLHPFPTPSLSLSICNCQIIEIHLKKFKQIVGFKSECFKVAGCVCSICWFLFSCRSISFAFNRNICINETYFQIFFCNLIAMLYCKNFMNRRHALIQLYALNPLSHDHNGVQVRGPYSSK